MFLKTMTKIGLILLVIGLYLTLGVFEFGIWWTVTFGTGANPPPPPLPVADVPVLIYIGYVLLDVGAILFLGGVLSKRAR